MGPPLILASASTARAHVLKEAGLVFTREIADVDEDRMKSALAAEKADTGTIAEALAVAKARKIAERFPGSSVIGADQILEIDGTRLDKPRDKEEASGHLKALRGRTHSLISAVCVARGGTVQWRHRETARLSMRAFSDDFLDFYLENAGPPILQSVGAYRLEGLGAQLFDSIDGDYFTILGLPLLPLLAFLRQSDILRR
jgi:septum formation protein